MNAMASSYQQYKKHNVLMASPLELIVMLYNGCIRKLQLARRAIDAKNYEEANALLQKAQEIVMELINGLDFQYGIALELMALYDFILSDIIRINTQKDSESIGPLIEVLGSLRDTWAKVQKQNVGGMLRRNET